MNKDQVKGRVDAAVGKVKEVAGNAFNSPGTELKGNVQKNSGKVQAAYGDLKEDVKDSVKKTSDI